MKKPYLNENQRYIIKTFPNSLAANKLLYDVAKVRLLRDLKKDTILNKIYGYLYVALSKY
jgi:hypothetical protein